MTVPKHSRKGSTEAALVARARLRDEDAITKLVNSHFPRLRWVAWRVVRNWADAEDVAQDSLCKAWQHLSDFQERAAFATWLTSIAVNEGVGLLRKRRTRPIDLAEGDAPLQELPWLAVQSQTPEQTLASREIEQTVRRCMERTRPDYRAVLYFSIFDELGPQEIAQRLGLSVAAVKLRLHRGRRVLRRMLQRQGAGFAGRHVPETIRGTVPLALASQASGN